MDGLVNVSGTVEPKALAGGIASEAHGRVAEAIALAINQLEEGRNGFNELQKIALVKSTIWCMDGFEASVLADLADTFGRIRVQEQNGG